MHRKYISKYFEKAVHHKTKHFKYWEGRGETGGREGGGDNAEMSL